MPDPNSVVVDASVLVDLYANTALAGAARERLDGLELHAPAHMDAEVMSALGRLHRAGRLSATHVQSCLEHLARSPLRRHPLSDLLVPAWHLRGSLRLLDAAYVALAEMRDATLLTTDVRLARGVDRAEVIAAP